MTPLPPNQESGAGCRAAPAARPRASETACGVLLKSTEPAHLLLLGYFTLLQGRRTANYTGARRQLRRGDTSQHRCMGRRGARSNSKLTEEQRECWPPSECSELTPHTPPFLTRDTRDAQHTPLSWVYRRSPAVKRRPQHRHVCSMCAACVQSMCAPPRAQPPCQ